MTQIASSDTRTASPDAAFAPIADRLDLIGQQYRILRLARGGILFVGYAITVLVTASILAGVAGQGRAAAMVLVVAAAWMIGSALIWLVRPFLLRPTPVQIARLVESQVPELHNGLTNSVLMAAREDLAGSTFLPTIFQEVLRTADGLPLNKAVSPSTLKPLAMWMGGLAIVSLAIAGVANAAVTRGLQQMFRPTQFIPTFSSAKLIDVKPGDCTLIVGQPLEISVLTEDEQKHDATLIFDDNSPPITLNPMTAMGSEGMVGVSGGGITTQRFSYRQDHVDHSLKYRIEVGGTQSPWYSVDVVKQVRLQQLELAITPPTYTLSQYAAKTITLTPDNLDKTPIAMPAGSHVAVTTAIDVPTTGAMLQLGDDTPITMTGNHAGTNYAGAFDLSHDVPMSVLLTQGGGQVIAKLPDQALSVHATSDAPPVIEMKWPTQDTTIAPDAPLKVQANLKDDYGLTEAHVMLATKPDAELKSVDDVKFVAGETQANLAFDIPLKAEEHAHGRLIRLRVDVTDNRDLGSAGGPQTTTGTVYEIRFRDPKLDAQERKDELDKLRGILAQMLKKQHELNDKTIAIKLDQTASLQPVITPVRDGQSALRDTFDQTAQTYPFTDADRMTQRTLQMLAANPAKDAIDLSNTLASEMAVPQRTKLSDELQSRQRRIISTLESLLALLGSQAEAATQPSSRGGELLSQSDAFKKLDKDMQEFMKEQRRILDQTAGLAKKAVDRFDDNDKAELAKLAMAQEKLDAFMQQKLSDFSKLAEQDMSNPALLKDITQAYSETTMAKDALKQKAVEMAIPAEENGLELAKEISSNLERWLSNTPDRQQWNMEDPLTKNDIPMPELPTQLEDMIGDLLEQEEDLMDQVQDTNANWHDSADKGIGWDAADGPIADMSAKGVTGNQLPNNNEMDGRSGEGRSGKSMGEFVGKDAVGKGGRNTPTRLDPTPFQKGQINDTSKDPTGGATGGGKLSGEGGEGLEGPVPPGVKQTMQRLAQKQAEIRNTAERLNLKYQLSRYDNFKLAEAGVMMRQVQTDLEAGRYQNAMRRRDLTLDTIDTSRLLMGGEIHVQQDTTPTGNAKTQSDIADAMKGQLPPAWADALKQYYEKLGQQ